MTLLFQPADGQKLPPWTDGTLLKMTTHPSSPTLHPPPPQTARTSAAARSTDSAICICRFCAWWRGGGIYNAITTLSCPRHVSGCSVFTLNSFRDILRSFWPGLHNIAWEGKHPADPIALCEGGSASMNVAFEWREASRHVDSLYLLYLGNGPDATSNSHNDVIMPPPSLSLFFSLWELVAHESQRRSLCWSAVYPHIYHGRIWTNQFWFKIWSLFPLPCYHTPPHRETEVE